MRLPVRPFLPVLCCIAILSSAVAFAQPMPDTIHVAGKVLIRNHGLFMYDSLEWQAMQWQRQERRQIKSPAPGSLMLKAARPLTLSQTHPHPLNNCGVTASFTPGNDSVVTTMTAPVTFTSTSTGATTFTWSEVGIPISNGNSFTWGENQPGLYDIMLVAQNGACTDTAIAYYLIKGVQSPDRRNIQAYYGTTQDEFTNDLAAVPSGGYILGGHGYTYLRSIADDGIPKGMLIKTSESGCVEWSKKIYSAFSGSLYKVLALQNGGYAISGTNDSITYVMQLDARGNPVWTKRYYLAGGPFHAQWMAETAGGGLVLAGGAANGGLGVVRIDASGNMRWGKNYAFASTLGTWYYVGDVMAQGPDIYFTATVLTNVMAGANTNTFAHGILIDINDADGKTRWTNEYKMNGDYLSPRDIHPYGGGLLLNSVGTSGVTNYNNTLNFLDLNGNPVRSTTLYTPGLTYSIGWSKVLPLPNGDMYMFNSGTETLNLQPGYAYHSVFMRLDASQNPIWAESYGHYGGGRFYFPVVGQNGVIAAAGDEIGQVVPVWRSFSDKQVFKTIDDRAGDWPSHLCNFFGVTVSTAPETVTAQPFSWISDAASPAVVADTVLSTYDIYAQVRYECPEFVDSCSYLKLTGTSSICDLSGGTTYRAHRNGACGEPVQWDLPPNVSLLGQTDTTVTLKFSSFGTYRIAATLPFACSPIKDTLFVVAASRSHPLTLGHDTTLCQNTSFVLHAGTGFLRYSWQDGSVDSVYYVTMPGTYTVQVADSCYNILTASVVVKPYADTVVNAGGSRVKCNADTIQIAAPAGYLSYSWSPNYQISSLTARQVVVNPALDTAYVLKAETIPGCFAYDTVHIVVKHSPMIRLGSDTSLCAGDSLLLDAGPGFMQYQWSTGSGTERVAAKGKGGYWVKATTADGCLSADTLQILNLYAPPPVGLDHSPGLCTGETRTLAAAPGYSYLWSTGSTASSINIRDTGSYSVIVADGHGCVSKDGVRVTNFLPVPSGFLPADTAICSYGKLEITPTSTFRSYAWSTGSTDQSITVAKPGTYWLEVTDDRSCVGTDTIVVAKKDCMEGFYIPNAFTSGGASNSLFKPLLFGNILRYEFGIINRWGQLIFQSNQPGAGWDGTYQGAPLTAGVYVWYCRYTLSGQSPQVKKGTVVLIR
ncbi:MAG: gliding motility-associated C-terminal domain-containing protein [Bacteroidota bacterium]|nr:gliding motility-associated C-terminal domain-containing protein [Bacteroidota bacterium]